MSKQPSKDTLHKVQTTALSRRLSMAKTGAGLGVSWARHRLKKALGGGQSDDAFAQEQARYLACELGKLKGSVVKIGQMMALYGEHTLPPVVTAALHQMDSQTAPLAWEHMSGRIKEALGNAYPNFDIQKTPIGTASLAQVYRAQHAGDTYALKVQYPGIDKAIESDLALFGHVLKMAGTLPNTDNLDGYLAHFSQMLRLEMDYKREGETLERFGARLADDRSYIVPKYYPRYSTPTVLAMSFEPGDAITTALLESLSNAQKRTLGHAMLRLLLLEVFSWGQMQTDPNFGNYLVRIEDEDIRLVLLDFGAVKTLDEMLLMQARAFLQAGYDQDKKAMRKAMRLHPFFDELSDGVKDGFVRLFLLASEPFADPNRTRGNLWDEEGNYDWIRADLYARIRSHIKTHAASLEFHAPPEAFVLVARKFIGAFSFLTALGAKTNARMLMTPFVAANDV